MNNLINRDKMKFINIGDYLQIRELDVYYKCVKCNGTGLGNYSRHRELTLWDGTSRCVICNGKGVFDFIENVLNGIETEEVIK